MEDIPAAIQNLIQAEKDKLKAKVEHNFEVAEQYRKDFEAAMVQRDAALLQIREMMDFIASVRNWGRGRGDFVPLLPRANDLVERFALKPKDECVQEPVGRALRYCSEYQKTSRDHAPSCGFVEKRKGEEHGA